MTYKYFSREIEPFHLTNGSINEIAIGQMIDELNKRWLTDVIFSGKTTDDENWNYSITFSRLEYKKYYIESIVDFLNCNKNELLKSSIFNFKNQMDNRTDIAYSKKLEKLFTTKNVKVK